MKRRRQNSTATPASPKINRPTADTTTAGGTSGLLVNDGCHNSTAAAAKISKKVVVTTMVESSSTTTFDAQHHRPLAGSRLCCPLLLPHTTSTASSSYPIVDIHTEDEAEHDFHGGRGGGIRIGQYHLIVNPMTTSASTSVSPPELITCHQAHHIPTGTPVRCQIMSAKEYEHFEKVKNRLTMTTGGLSDNFQYDEDEMNEETRITNAIIPKDIEIIRNPFHQQNNDNAQQHHPEYILFSPQNYASLRDLIQKKKCLPEEKAQPLFHQILKIVAFCHSRGIIVRNLKLGKFVFTDPAQKQLGLLSTNDLTLCDVDSNDDGGDSFQFRQWCPAFVSPEILDLNRSSCSGKAADIWSMGVLLFVMLFGRYPFYHTSPLGLFQRIRACQWTIYRHERCRYETRLLLHGLLTPCPSKRPSCAELLRSGWFTRHLRRHHRSRNRQLFAEQYSSFPSLSNDVEAGDSASNDYRSNLTQEPIMHTAISQRPLGLPQQPVSFENQTVPNISMI